MSASYAPSLLNTHNGGNTSPYPGIQEQRHREFLQLQSEPETQAWEACGPSAPRFCLGHWEAAGMGFSLPSGGHIHPALLTVCESLQGTGTQVSAGPLMGGRVGGWMYIVDPAIPRASIDEERVSFGGWVGAVTYQR